MPTLEVDYTGEFQVVRHNRRTVLLAFKDHLQANEYLKFSYPMPDQESGEGWLMFLYSPIDDALVASFDTSSAE